MSLIKFKPVIELSSNLPTKGETYAAPAFADRIACATSKIRVTFTLIRSLQDSSAQASKPSGVQGTLIVADFGNFVASRIPS